MRVFVLCTGRCGSLTFARACGHIRNYGTGHESRVTAIVHRLDYPDRHIEVDHRLSFFLGTLAERFDPAETVWVHLTRDPEETAASWVRRFGVEGGMMQAWGAGVIANKAVPRGRRLDLAESYVATVTDNITGFLRDKPLVVRAEIEDPHDPFDRLWDMIGAVGDRQAAHAELAVRHNPT